MLRANWPVRPKAWMLGLMLALSVAAGLTVFAAEAPDPEAARVARERADIQAERDRLEALFAAEFARCTERFAVTACQDDVRERRRAALAGPRARALALDDAERRSRAAARREALAQKQRRAATRPPAAEAVASAPTVTAPSPVPEHPDALPQPSVAPSSAAAEAAAAQRAAAARRRQAAIQADQARIEARQAARARQGRPAAALPLPAASGPGAAMTR